MVESIAIYIEGGGDSSETKGLFRRGISAFLRPIVIEARKRRIRWRLIVCGGRQQAYDKFCDALVKEPDFFNVLLVDSEEPVAIDVEPWGHLSNREGDRWERPVGADDTRCQLMVACMEAWFLADPDNLSRHFGHNFDHGKLPLPDQAEAQTTTGLDDALRNATRNTKRKEYQKIRDGAKLLERVDPAEVRRHCKWCDRLFKTLGEAIGATI